VVKARIVEDEHISEEKKKELLEDYEVPFDQLSEQISVTVRFLAEGSTAAG
jgi:hypothetical protein